MSSSTCLNPFKQQIKQQAGKSMGRKIIHQIHKSLEVLIDLFTIVIILLWHGLQKYSAGTVPRSACPRSGIPSGSPRLKGHLLVDVPCPMSKWTPHPSAECTHKHAKIGAYQLIWISISNYVFRWITHVSLTDCIWAQIIIQQRIISSYLKRKKTTYFISMLDSKTKLGTSHQKLINIVKI